MPTFDAEWLYMTILLVPPLLLSITVHEFAHARTALAFGDPTAKYSGRVSLNPLRHLDPIGTLVMILTHFIGWAKPVPVNPANLHPRRLGNIMVSLAGPLSNLVLAIVCASLLRVWWLVGGAGGEGLFTVVVLMLFWTTVANLGLCAFNLIPLFPLDGHHILAELLPANKQGEFMYWQRRYGMMLLGALIFLPRLIETVTQQPAPVNPIRFLYSHIIHLVQSVLGLV